MDSNLWKSKDELKKYIENLGTEYRYGCFEEKNPDVCHLLGDYLQSIDKAYKKALTVFKDNCDGAKFGLSCDAFARMAFRGQGFEAPDVKLALEYFIIGCDLGEARACYHGGQMLGVVDKHVNKLIPPQPDKSIEMLKKACLSGKQAAACTLVHSFYLKGVHGKPADLRLAAEYAQIACDQDEYMSCYNLSRMYHLGEGVQVDVDKSKFYSQRAKDIRSGIKKTLEVNPNATPDA